MLGLNKPINLTVKQALVYVVALYILSKLVRAGFRRYNQAAYYKKLNKFIAERRKFLEGPEREDLFKMSERVSKDAEKFLRMDIA